MVVGPMVSASQQNRIPQSHCKTFGVCLHDSKGRSMTMTPYKSSGDDVVYLEARTNRAKALPMIKVDELTQPQAEVRLNKAIATSLISGYKPTIQTLGMSPQLRNVDLERLCVTLRVPGKVTAFNPSQYFDECHDKHSFIDNAYYLPRLQGRQSELGVITLFPPSTGYFATFQTTSGVKGLPLSKWTSLVDIWKSLTSELRLYVRREYQVSGQIYSPNEPIERVTLLGLDGFVATDVSKEMSPQECRVLINAQSLFDNNNDEALTEDIDGVLDGISLCLTSGTVRYLNTESSVIMEIQEFDSKTDHWILRFDDSDFELRLPYRYDDFFTKGFKLKLDVNVVEHRIQRLLRYELCNDFDDTRCSYKQLMS